MPPLHIAAGDLVIVESPATAKTIDGSACPGHVVVAAGNGVGCDLAKEL